MDMDEVAKFVHAYDTLSETLLFLIHLGTGMPLRGSEHASLNLRATATDRGHVFNVQELCGLFGTYNKANSTRGVHTVPRFVAPPISAILNDQLSLLRPIYEKAVGLLRQQLGLVGAVDVSAFYLKLGVRLTDKEIRDIIARSFNVYCNLRGVTISIWRQASKVYFRALHRGFKADEEKILEASRLSNAVMALWASGDDGPDEEEVWETDELADILVRGSGCAFV